jgi:hypothetical protein
VINKKEYLDGVVIAKKNEVLEILKAMVYAKSNEHFNQLYDQLKTINGLQNLIPYFEKNWLVNKEQWVLYYREHIYTRGTNTNNRIERHNKEIKTKVHRNDHLIHYHANHC